MSPSRQFILELRNNEYSISSGQVDLQKKLCQISVDGTSLEVILDHLMENRIFLNVNGVKFEVSFGEIPRFGQEVKVKVNGTELQIKIISGHKRAPITSDRSIQATDENNLLTGHSPGDIVAPMPGTVVAVKVKTGQNVDKDQVVCILESMKMENEMRTPVEGTVGEVRISVGQTVNKGDLLLKIAQGS